MKPKSNEAFKSLLEAQPTDDVRVVTHVAQGASAHLIRQKVDEVQADLLVMGTVSRAGLAGFFFGNTAESVLAKVNCSILALKPNDFVCPITESEDASNHTKTVLV